jgi:hypothetical protein
MDKPDVYDRRKFELKKSQFVADTIKHMTTLATGTVVLTATLSDRLPKPVPTYGKVWLALSLLGMSVCIILSFLMLFSIGVRLLWEEDQLDRRAYLNYEVGRRIAWAIYVSFRFGIICLSLAALVLFK